MAERVIKEARYDYKYRESMTPEQIVAMFNDFAKEYDEDALKAHACMSAPVIAEYLIKYYKPEERSEVILLDVAAGTGALGHLLKGAGFVNMDGLDPAEKMLDVARAKNVYQRYICEYMDGRRIPEILTGGLVVFAVPDRYQELGYKGKFQSLLTRLVEEGVWEKVVHLHLEDGWVSYRGSGPGKLFSYRVKVSEMFSDIE